VTAIYLFVGYEEGLGSICLPATKEEFEKGLDEWEDEPFPIKKFYSWEEFAKYFEKTAADKHDGYDAIIYTELPKDY